MALQPPASVELLHVDESIVVACKPPGLLAVPGRGADKADCLSARVQSLFDDALVVHRLDMATSGLMLFARGPAVQRSLSAAFESRQVEKRYTAIVAGWVEEDTFTIALPLAADWPQRPRQRVDVETGKPATTHVRVLHRDAGASRCTVELVPVTGRTHQLRVHLAAQGHPIVGDALYGGPGHERMLLHAAELAFSHPATGEACRFVSEPGF